jgi:hypothetical protein
MKEGENTKWLVEAKKLNIWSINVFSMLNE